jgi:hypothetical protein
MLDERALKASHAHKDLCGRSEQLPRHHLCIRLVACSFDPFRLAGKGSACQCHLELLTIHPQQQCCTSQVETDTSIREAKRPSSKTRATILRTMETTPQTKSPRHPLEASDSRRFTRITPSVTTDSEHEVLVELNSDSDIPMSKARKDRYASSAAITDRKKIVDRKKRTSTSPFPGGPILSEDLLYHLMEQNKLLMDQNKALTRRVEILEPAMPTFPPPEVPVVWDLPLHPGPPDLFPELRVPETVKPVKPKSKRLDEDELYAHYREIWDVLPRLLRLIEATAKSTKLNTPLGNFPEHHLDEIIAGAGMDEFMYAMQGMFRPDETTLLSSSKNTFSNALLETERRFGVDPKSKKSKRLKSKLDTGRFDMISRANLVPVFWKGLGLVRVFVLIFITVQLYFMGGEMLRVSKESSKKNAWMGVW